MERRIERLLWSSRLSMGVAAFASVAIALGTLFMATVDAAYVLAGLAEYPSPSLDGAARAALRAAMITGVVKALDGFLLAAIMLIFAYGLYELFVSRIDPAARSESAPRLLKVRSLDDLKNRLAKVVLLVLAIEFFQHALKLDYGSASDLLLLALGTLLVALALWVTTSKAESAPNVPHAGLPAGEPRD